MPNLSSLASMPAFLRAAPNWNGLLDPRDQRLRHPAHPALRNARAAHKWDIEWSGYCEVALTDEQFALLDIAQSLLERGVWTLPSWRLEKGLAEFARAELGWEVLDEPGPVNALRMSSKQADPHFQTAVLSARWPCEVECQTGEDIWGAFEGDSPGSDEERLFFFEVLVPVLGWPLLDFLRLQADLPSLGLDPSKFMSQRADFSLDTGRDLRLVVEIDGTQHKDPAQRMLDSKRDAALQASGWSVWRVPTREFDDLPALRATLKKELDRRGTPVWGVVPCISTPRSRSLLTCVWGATVAARIQFLILEALRSGSVDWHRPTRVAILEAETDIARLAIDDFTDWFGRLARIFGQETCGGLSIVNVDATPDLLIDVSVCAPHKQVREAACPVAWSRPANIAAPIPRRKFSKRLRVFTPPAPDDICAFANDFLRVSTLRDGQFEILSRILAGQDVVGLLPTGGGKSLTYQIAGLLLGGLTIYVAPLKSLLQDQRRRFREAGIDLAEEISSSQSEAEKQAGMQLLSSGGIRFLLIAPERLLMQSFRDLLSQFRVTFGEVSQVVVDECHCVSEWGHDFRPAYLCLSRIVKQRSSFGSDVPLVALTGTASSIVLSDVKRELGILDEGASVYAKRLDRPEIDLQCLSVRTMAKPDALGERVRNFLVENRAKKDGIIIFCRFVNGPHGVVAVAASLLRSIPSNQIRFYAGSNPDWRKFAGFRMRKKAYALKPEEVASQLPDWAVAANASLRQWEEVKAETQAVFCTDEPRGFRTLIATQAFGMGIDKGSVRQVIHYCCPPSPEAYYQEVGRAGRDGRPAIGLLLFSDENAEVADRILDPNTTVYQAAQTYQNFQAQSGHGAGGDFITTFFFHQNSFAGPDSEAQTITRLISEVRDLLRRGRSLILGYLPDEATKKTIAVDGWKGEKNAEFGLVRLIALGVIKEYLKDFNRKQFSLVLNEQWDQVRDDVPALAQFYAGQYREYVRRYQTFLRADGEEVILEAKSVEELDARAPDALVRFIYDKVEKRRREASRSMLEFARAGVVDAAEFRRRLINYLQVSEKFTAELEQIAKAEPGDRSWKQLLDRVVGERDAFAELGGACQRVLESYPENPSLRAISASSRLNPSLNDLRRSEEDLRVAVAVTAATVGPEEAQFLGDAVTSLVSQIDESLAVRLDSVYGLWLIENGMTDKAVSRFFVREPVRAYWVQTVLEEIQQAIPSPRG